MRHREFRHRAGRIHSNVPAGFILLLVGGVLLAKQLGVIFPEWLIRWETLLIAIGLLVGIKSRFQHFGWLVPVGIGTFFLMNDFYPDLRNFVWPIVIIGIGLLIILRPHRQKKSLLIADEPMPDDATPLKEDVLDTVSVLGGTKKIVLSKNFKGGEVVCVFGGAEINLTQADFTGPVKIEIVAVFGGAKLIVPANWEVRSDTTAILGGIDDKRDPAALANPEKTLILDGTVIFGGVEISSY
jgi:predicted membrane protein